ncbi:hypothetical protein OG784_31880 [Streptomyces sp. NBC_01617]|uniref:hypothetical protein n=1 Tax=unclassified Streptomyces TaxID=2593676 RepID=UPI00386B2F30|nr:hypothetical protein OG987_32030 [Streptomyces sp. NBC_01620]WTE63049.1 hypothetical protein OG784_31880 [Streptomyces sp. NBC_01617]
MPANCRAQSQRVWLRAVSGSTTPLWRGDRRVEREQRHQRVTEETKGGDPCHARVLAELADGARSATSTFSP